MKSRIPLVFTLIFLIAILVNAVQAQETDYKYLWSYVTGYENVTHSSVMITGVSISSDGSYIAAGSQRSVGSQPGGVVYFFSRDGKFLWSYKTDGIIRGVSVSSDASYIAAGSDDDKVYFFNHGGKLLWSNKTDSSVDSVSVSSDGSYIAAESMNKVYLIDRENKLLWSSAPSGGVFSVSISSDGSYIATASWEINLFNHEGKLLWNYKPDMKSDRTNFVRSVSVSSDGSYIAAGSDDGKVHLFNREGKLLWSSKTDCELITGFREICATAVSVSSDGSYIATGSEQIYLFNRDGKRLWKSKSYRESLGCSFEGVSLSSDGSYLAAGSSCTDVYLFADMARVKAARIGNLQVKTAIDEAKSIISQEKAKGFNVQEAESVLEDALKSFNTTDSFDPVILAEKAKSLAMDIDQDGITNEEDFAPSINNYYIYSGAAIFLVGSVIALKMHQRLANERRRREEEERRRLKGMKQEIIDKIEEVTKK